VTDICDSNSDKCARPAAQAALHGVFMSMIDKVERDIRLQLAEKLADAAWAPPALIAYLARDDVEIARPVIARSPLLRDPELIRLLVDTTLDHHIEVARRPRLGASVVDAILAQGEADVLSALAANDTAEVSPLAMARLVSFSQTMAGLRAPLARHPRLTAELGGMLYAWVGETLRGALVGRFEVDREAFAAVVQKAVAEAHGAPGDGVSLELDDRAAMDRRVVEKLKAGGQLRAGLLLRALRDGKLTLFTIALAELGGFTTDEVRVALDADTPELLSLACAAVGVDKGAMPSLLTLVRSLNGARPGGEAEVARDKGLITLLDRDSAARSFRKRIAVA
jgi:uncharacterized protein (DUF2336 family)